jgi:hypothetical protein
MPGDLDGDPSGAKARIDFAAFAARLKSCPDTKPALSRSWFPPLRQKQERRKDGAPRVCVWAGYERDLVAQIDF